MNARRAPEGIGEGHGADELRDLRIDGWTTGSTAPRLPVPERAEALPVPANHGLRLNDLERFTPPCPPLREPHPEDAVEETEPRSVRAFSAARRVPSRASTRDISAQAGLTGDPRPAWRPIFWPTTGSSDRPGTFDLLGFTHYWGLSRKGKWVVKRKTARDRLSRALKRVAQWCRLHRHHPIEEQQQTLAQKLRGHFGYYGITGTSKRSNTSANRSCASGASGS